jgi:CARDB protein
MTLRAPLLACWLVLLAVLVPPARAQAPEVTGPFIRTSAAPHVFTQDLRNLPRVRPFRDGDPVRVIEDLVEDVRRQIGGPGSQAPALSASAAPQTQERDVRDLPRVPPLRPGDPVREVQDLRETEGPRGSLLPQAGAAGVRDATSAPAGLSASPQFLGGFDGIPATGWLPPDTVGDVGPKHYVQAVNIAFAVYDKTGTLLAGPAAINSLWSGFGGPCETLNNGDPVVRYDHLADRWLVSQFALPGGSAGLHECIAISRTGDPVSGGWFLYDFPTVDGATGNSVFPDYPKIGVWPDAYYMGTQRGFPGSGLDVWAFERADMLGGNPAQLVQFSVPAPSLFLLPSDLDGPEPPAGTPNFFGRQVDGDRFGGTDRFEVFAFAVNWGTPAASSFSLAASLPTTPFDSMLCSGGLIGTCIPQPGTAQRLESLTVWPMWRLQYRNFGTHETLLTNHTVDVDGRDRAGIRWYELRRPPAGAWSIFQQGTHSPDAIHRWMGSVASDHDANIALAYSVSSDRIFPGLRYAGRLVADPPGTMQAEVNLIAGGGSQTHGSSRWGNYSTLDVDPVDDCTFWYTSEYYPTTSLANWRTRISSFKNPACGQGRATFEYAAKLICGVQKDPKEMRLARGFYATTINVHNPQREDTTFFKKLALTIPPGRQRPGKVIPIATDKLGPDEALAVDCEDLRRRLFNGTLPAPYIEGFVVIQSPQSLDVTAVYSTAALNREGIAESHSSVHVEQIRERTVKVGPPGGKPDLIVKDIDMSTLKVSCPGGGGTCVSTVQVTIANIGTADAGPFTTRTRFDPAQAVAASSSFGGLAAGASQSFMVTTPPGGNCFDPDCTICAFVDDGLSVPESNEGNNELCRTKSG